MRLPSNLSFHGLSKCKATGRTCTRQSSGTSAAPLGAETKSNSLPRHNITVASTSGIKQPASLRRAAGRNIFRSAHQGIRLNLIGIFNRYSLYQRFQILLSITVEKFFSHHHPSSRFWFKKLEFFEKFIFYKTICRPIRQVRLAYCLTLEVSLP